VTPRREAGFPDDEPWRVPSLRESRYSQSLERGLAVLACFTPERPVLGIGEIAAELGMSPSTTHRYVLTLAVLGYLQQDASRKYRLAVRVTDLGMSALSTTGLREHAHSYLEELRTQSSYTVSIAVLDGPEIVYIDRARSFRRGQAKIDLGLRPGAHRPAYCTAMGKVLLAHLPEHELSRTLNEMRLERRGPNTLTNKGVLRRELAQIREDAFAVNDEELAPGHHAIAVPVYAHSKEVVAALGMAAHNSMIPLEAMVEHLRPPRTSSPRAWATAAPTRRRDKPASSLHVARSCCKKYAS